MIRMGCFQRFKYDSKKDLLSIVQRLEKNRPKIFRILESFEFTFII